MRLHFIENNKPVSYQVENVIFDQEYDVCVVGLGTAGSVCAIAAAKNGLNTIGIEKNKKVGGLCVNGGVCSYFYGNKVGLSRELIDEEYTYLDKNYLTACTDKNIEDGSSAELKNYVLNQNLNKYGCSVLTDTDVCGVYAEDRTIVGIRTVSDTKVANIKAKIFIDCSSSAVLSRSFGCKILPGRLYDGKTMRYSKAVGRANNHVFKDLSCGWFHYDYSHMPDQTDKYRVAGVWSVFGLPDQSSLENYCKNQLECSAVGPCNTQELKSNERPYFIGTMFGERESYHVECDKVLTLQNVIKKDESIKPLLYTFSPLDCTNHDSGFETSIMQDWRYCMSDVGFSLAIGKESFIAKDADNLLVAGKILGVDHTVAGGVRMRADMEQSGEVAAAIAKVAISNNCSLRDADYNQIAKILTDANILNQKCNKELADLSVSLTEKNKAFKFIDDSDIKKDFESNLASHSLWKTAYVWNDDKRKQLFEWINSGTDTFRLNCAISLGMAGYKTGKEIIISFINKQAKVPCEELAGGKYAQVIKAMSIAQRFGWTEVFDTAKKSFQTYGLNFFPENPIICRIFFTSVVMGYFSEIYKLHPQYREQIEEIIKSTPKPSESTMNYIYSTAPFLK